MNDQKTLMDRLRELSPGERAALRREAGKCLAEADGMTLSVFFRIAPHHLNRHQQECWFSAMTIACLWNPEEAICGDEFPVMLKEYARRQTTDGMKRKMRSLLDARWEEDGYLTAKLSRLARMLKADNHQLMPDVERLLYDLLHWNSDSRFVQIRWAQQYYQLEIDADEMKDEEE